MSVLTSITKKTEIRDHRRLLCEQLYFSLSRTLSLPEPELRRLLNFERHASFVSAGRQLQQDGESGKARILVSGWVCQQRILEDGRRQIFSFFLPGDAFSSRYPGMAHANLVALTGVVVLDATLLEQMAALPGAQAALAGYFAKMEQKRIGFLYSHILRLGSENAYERLRSLLRELFQRLSQAGFCHNGSVQLPLTQEMLADCLGVSAVHINRVLQQMRSDGVVKLQDGRLILGSASA